MKTTKRRLCTGMHLCQLQKKEKDGDRSVMKEKEKIAVATEELFCDLFCEHNGQHDEMECFDEFKTY